MNLTTLNGANGFMLTGVSVDYSGYSVAGVGDVNGDGIADLMIGAPQANNHAGATYVVFGHKGAWISPVNLTTLNGTHGFMLTGVSDDQSGWSVAGAGDVNGDEIADLMISARYANSDAGTTYVVFGHKGAWISPVNLTTLNGTHGFTLTGVVSRAYSGGSVVSAGDVNGDGIADLIIGARYANSRAGATYVVFGHKGAWTSPVNLTTLNGTHGFTLAGVKSGDYSGWSVASAGDVNGDGIADLMIGAPNANSGDLIIGAPPTGAAYVVFGHKGAWTSPVNLTTLNGTHGFTFTGVVSGDYSASFGSSVASAGDVNGDGIADLIIGAPSTGTTYVVFGHKGAWTSPVNLTTLNGTHGFTLTGVTANERSGYSVASAGDVNGDGIADLMIGAPWASDRAGATYVVFGATASSSEPQSNIMAIVIGSVVGGVVGVGIAGGVYYRHQKHSTDNNQEKLFQELLVKIRDLLKQDNIKIPRIFISYAWEDDVRKNKLLQTRLIKLQEDLKKLDLENQSDVFLDLGKMQGDMRQCMQTNIEAANYLFLIGTPRLKKRIEEHSLYLLPYFHDSLLPAEGNIFALIEQRNDCMVYYRKHGEQQASPLLSRKIALEEILWVDQPNKVKKGLIGEKYNALLESLLNSHLGKSINNVIFELGIALDRAQKMSVGGNGLVLMPLLYEGNFHDAFPEEVKKHLVRNFNNPSKYHHMMIGLTDPLGIIPAICPELSSNTEYIRMVCDFENGLKRKKLEKPEAQKGQGLLFRFQGDTQQKIQAQNEMLRPLITHEKSIIEQRSSIAL